METAVISEFVKIEMQQTITNEKLGAKTDQVNSFLQKQDGFMDTELKKASGGNICYFIFGIDNKEKLKTVGEKFCGNKLFDGIKSLIDFECLNGTFSIYE